MKKLIFLTLILIIITPLISFGQESNAGFASGIWFSKTPFFSGEIIKIYSAIRNNSGHNITGTIKFFDNGKIIGESDFSSANGRLIEKWIDLTVSEGDHKFQTKIFDSKNEKGEVVLLGNSLSEVVSKYADIDTDNDGIGNREDDDDDNDGITDDEEKKNGSNPLVFDKKKEEVKAESDKSTEEKNTIEEGKKLTEKFVIEPAKIATEKVLEESKPVIEKVASLLQEKQKLIEEKIQEDRDKESSKNLAAAAGSGFYEKIREKLPPTFRILYNWLLKFLIILFKIWWIPLILFILILLRIILGFYRKIRK